MLICLYRRPANAAYRVWGARIVASATLLLAFFAAPSTFAAPTINGQECTLTTYYSTAKKVTKVGTFAHCAGAQAISSGKKTAFFTTITFRLPILGGPNSPPLSCEIIDGEFTCTSNPANH